LRKCSNKSLQIHQKSSGALPFGSRQYPGAPDEGQNLIAQALGGGIRPMNDSKIGEAGVDATIESPPQTAHHNSWREFWKILISFDRTKLAPYMAFRNAAGLVLSLALGVGTHLAFGGAAAALGALFTSYSDGTDPYRHRALRMLAASATIALAAFVGGMFGQVKYGVAVVAAAAAFVAGMVVAFGQAAADIGMVSLVMLTIFSGQVFTPRNLVESCLLALSGGLVQTALSVILWPVRRYKPERRALAALYVELARTAQVSISPGDAPPATVHTSRAQDALRSLRQDRGEASLRLQSLLNQAERARLSVITLLRMQAQLKRKEQAGEEDETLSRVLSVAGRALAAIGESLLSGKEKAPLQDQLAKMNELSEQLRARAIRKPSSPEAVAMKDMLYQMDALAGQLRSAAYLVAGSASADGVPFEQPSRLQAWRVNAQSALATLRANLHFRSAVFRHAVRLAICVAIAGAIARATGWHRAYWIPMTVVIVLRPDFAGTFTRGLQRIAGTILGVLVATAQFHLLPQTFAVQATLIGVCVLLLRWLGPANYGFFAMGVSSAIVLLLALTGSEHRFLIHARYIDTLLGGMVALSAYALWPTREPVEHALAEMLAAYREYFGAVARCYFQRQTDGDLADRKRLGTRMARSNLEASVDRLAAEPGTEARHIEPVRSMLAASHRLAHAIMALEAVETDCTSTPATPELLRFVADVQTTLANLEGMLRERKIALPEMPDLRNDFRVLLAAGDQRFYPHALASIEADTIVNTVNTLRDLILRWQEQQLPR
jgi:uncharacterized membrane protein YccC